ncbi:MAG: hypothetical protein NW220_11660 [Leptolyngbyaceae cyanobacterium bins.349]|nr:hypothetical protein [Leptolyngbyaceae cyanobacterium bins.349]
MSKETMSYPVGAVAVGHPDLRQWAPAVTQEVENYPNYWRLKGWKCVVSR